MLVDLNKHLHRGSNFKFTYDDEGEFIFLKHQEPLKTTFGINCRNAVAVGNEKVVSLRAVRSKSEAVAKKWNIVAEDVEEDEDEEKTIRMKASKQYRKKGKVSPLSTSLTCSSQIELSPMQMTKRRTIYCNNELRQTTSAPFFRAAKGSSYT